MGEDYFAWESSGLDGGRQAMAYIRERMEVPVSDEYLIAVLYAVCDFMRGQNQSDLRGARQRKKDAGLRGEGRVPYGGSDKNGKVRAGEPETLARIYADADSGASCRAIADHLVAAGILTRYAMPWRETTIRRLLAARQI